MGEDLFHLAFVLLRLALHRVVACLRTLHNSISCAPPVLERLDPHDAILNCGVPLVAIVGLRLDVHRVEGAAS